MIIKRCKGCGAVLQNNNEALAGFIPVLKEDSTTCRRCFRMIHYNELPKIVAKNEDYERVIDSVAQKKALMVYIVDIFAFKTTFLDLMIDKLRNSDVLVLVNKVDLLPKSCNLDRVIEWVEAACQAKFFKVLGVGLISAKKNLYVEDLVSVIDAARKERDVYFVGCANVGKSSVINALLRHTMNQSNDVIATSMIPGTTLNEIRIPYFIDNRALIDTPGLINPADVLSKVLSPKSISLLMPTSELKPITYQITDGNSIFLGGLASISFSSKEMVPVTVYTAKTLYLHRCKTSKVEGLWENQLGKLLVPPTEEEINSLKYKVLTFDLKGRKAIWFSGFGFIQVQKDVKVMIKVLEHTEVYITNALIGIR